MPSPGNVRNLTAPVVRSMVPMPPPSVAKKTRPFQSGIVATTQSPSGIAEDRS